jgi:hypothetical protein
LHQKNLLRGGFVQIPAEGVDSIRGVEAPSMMPRWIVSRKKEHFGRCDTLLKNDNAAETAEFNLSPN